jgi:hypothetical protein
MSGKRNNLEDFLIVELERSWLLGTYDRERDPSECFALALLQNLLDSAKDQVLGRTAFAGCAAPQAAINGIGYVDRGSHLPNLPYLWSLGATLALLPAEAWPLRRMSAESRRSGSGLAPGGQFRAGLLLAASTGLGVFYPAQHGSL